MEQSTECFIEHTLIAKCVVHLSVIEVSYFMVKKYYFTFKLVLYGFSGPKY